jgi:thiol-disulfide isomerase/thioredoxin
MNRFPCTTFPIGILVATILLGLCSTVATAAQASAISPIVDAGKLEERTDAEASISAALESGRSVFLFFYSDWCSSCQKEKTIIDRLEQEYSGRITFIRLNSERDSETFKKFGVSSFPTLLLITPRGSGGYHEQKFVGMTGENQLAQALGQVPSLDSRTAAMGVNTAPGVHSNRDAGSMDAYRLINSTSVDSGAPVYRPAVRAGEKDVALLMPWIVVFMATMAGAIIIGRRRLRSHSKKYEGVKMNFHVPAALGLALIVAACASTPAAPKAPTPAPITAPGTSAAPKTLTLPDIHGVFGSPVTFATHNELESYGFAFGPSDGQFGAIPTGDNSYIFYGAGGSTAACAGTPRAKGAFSFNGTLDHVIGGNGCTRLFGPGDAPQGWVFDRNYAGGGQVVRFEADGKRGWLMPFHGEVWWENPETSDHKCSVAGGSGSKVECFYSTLGLAVSLDNGKTFQVAGQILQPSQPMSVFTGRGTNMSVGYGSLIVADANGKHVDNPPANPNDAYFYLFYSDRLAGLPGACATGICMGVARATYTDVIAAALSGDPHRVAKVFKKYDAASPNSWTQPATSDTPDLSGTAGRYAPLWTDEPGGAAVIYDSRFDVYLAVYQTTAGIKVRASNDLIHWSRPIGDPYRETGRTLYYPTPIGETGDPTTGGVAPRVYFSSFPTGLFPDYRASVFESVPITLSSAR